MFREHINMKKCLNCGYERKPRDEGIVPATECPQCHIIYDKIKDGDEGWKWSTYQQGTDSKKKKKTSGCLIKFAVLFAAIMICGLIAAMIEIRNTNLVEANFTPVIVALEKYKTANGRYPDKLESLTPTYLDTIPSCPGSSKPGNVFYTSDSGEYTLCCYVFLFDKRWYNSSTKKWWTTD